MKIINKNLPDSVYQWILKVQGKYTKGDADISVTELINPPRVRILKKKYYDRLVVEAESLLNVTVGSTIHNAIELATKDGHTERRLETTVLGWKLSGGMDHYHDGILTDYKTANKFKTMNCSDGRIEEWEEQLNVYAYILRTQREPIPVNHLQIWAYFKDWNNGEFGVNSRKGQIFRPNLSCGYPEKTELTIPIKLWSFEEQKAYVEERVRLHQEAEKVLPECREPQDNLYGGKRCGQYCEVGMNGFCEQYNQKLKEKKNVINRS